MSVVLMGNSFILGEAMGSDWKVVFYNDGLR